MYFLTDSDLQILRLMVRDYRNKVGGDPTVHVPDVVHRASDVVVVVVTADIAGRAEEEEATVTECFVWDVLNNTTGDYSIPVYNLVDQLIPKGRWFAVIDRDGIWTLARSYDASNIVGTVVGSHAGTPAEFFVTPTEGVNGPLPELSGANIQVSNLFNWSDLVGGAIIEIRRNRTSGKWEPVQMECS